MSKFSGKISKNSVLFEKLNKNFLETEPKMPKLNEKIAETRKYKIFSYLIKLKGVQKKAWF